MGVLDWSVNPNQNATTDPAIAARDGASARQIPSLSRGIMAGVAALTADQGGALVSTGTDNAYVVATLSGVATLRPGTTISFWADRDNTASPSLNVDGTGPKQWLNGDGSALPVGSIRKDSLCTVTWFPAPAGPSSWRLVSSGKQIAAVSDVPGLGSALDAKANRNLTVTLGGPLTEADVQTVIDGGAAGDHILIRLAATARLTLNSTPLLKERIVSFDVDPQAQIGGSGDLPFSKTSGYPEWSAKRVRGAEVIGSPTRGAQTRDPVRVFGKFGGPAGPGLNPTVAIFGVKAGNTTGTASQALYLEVQDTGGWNGQGGNNFFEVLHITGLGDAPGTSPYGIAIYVANKDAQTPYHLMFGAEIGVANQYRDALPYSVFYGDARIASCLNLTSSGPFKPDGYLTTNLFDPPERQPQAAFLSVGSVGTSGFAYASSCTTQVGFDARYGTLTYALMAGPNGSPIRMQNAAKTADVAILNFDSGNRITIGLDSGVSSIVLGRATEVSLDLNIGGNTNPINDNASDLGSGGRRFRNLYVANNPITGSDASLKTNTRSLSEPELAAARRISPRVFQYRAAIAEKGEDKARLHFGVIAQEVVAAFRSEGLDAFRYGVVGSDPEMQEVTRTRLVKRPKMETVAETVIEFVRDGDVIRQKPTVQTREVPVTVTLPVLDEAGAPVMGMIVAHDEAGQVIYDDVPVRDDDTGEARAKRRPKKIPGPLTKTLQVEEEVEEPFVEIVATGRDLLSVRYEQLAVFMLAALMPAQGA